MLWTRDSIAQLIKQFPGISIPVRTVCDYLKCWDFTLQKTSKAGLGENPRQK
ncbi:winged helix-turn-helix domain-containing protein [Candidatus Vondammii sp. HM_W22]|uniref:winged helix-turn-helix domain-containing protein n=1 Tax=Candidatus Vondammii sp. HM_W22 TaxID=2687299 RepID=UPI00403DE840